MLDMDVGARAGSLAETIFGTDWMAYAASKAIERKTLLATSGRPEYLSWRWLMIERNILGDGDAGIIPELEGAAGDQASANGGKPRTEKTPLLGAQLFLPLRVYCLMGDVSRAELWPEWQDRVRLY